MKKLFFILAWLCLYIPVAQAQHNIKGEVFDAQTKEPVVGAVVRLKDTENATQTDAVGKFELNAPTTSPALQITLMGYENQEVSAGIAPLKIAFQASVGNLQEVIVSANREASLRTEAPIAISKISSKTIEEAKPTAIYEVINKTSGVLMVNLNNEQHSMSIRQPMTTSGYYLYMEDGIAIRPLGVFNHNALLEINQFTVSSIEVVKGPVSSIYGAEAVGGTINFITQRPTTLPTAKIGIQFDQWGYRRLQVGAGARLGKFGMYVGAMTSQQTSSWMANSDYDKTSVNARLEYNFSSKTRLISTLVYGKYFSDTGGSVDSIAFYNREYVSTTDFTYRKSEAIRSRLALEHDWHKNAHTFLTVFQRSNAHGQNPSYGIRWTVGQNTARGEINSNNFRSLGVLAQHSQKFTFLNSKLIAGVMFDFSPNDYWSYQINLNARLHPDGKSVEQYTIKEERPDLKLADYKAKIRNSAGYLQYDAEVLPRLRVSGGLRFDLMSFTYDNFLDNSSGSKEYHNITPKLGLTYDLGKDKGLYVNYSQGFAPPALTAIFRRKSNTNPAEFYYNLEPARFQNYEIGGWASLIQNKLYIDMALYQMNGQNELLNIRQPDNSFDYQSAGKTLHRGIELGLTYKPTPQFLFRFSGANAIHRFEDFQISTKQQDAIKNLSGFEMPSAPRFVWNTELSYYPVWLKGLRTALEWQRVSGWYQNQINTVRYEGYHLLNFRVGYTWKGLEVFTNVMNLTNALYATNASRGNNATDRTNFTPSAPRTFVMGVQYAFTKK